MLCIILYHSSTELLDCHHILYSDGPFIQCHQQGATEAQQTSSDPTGNVRLVCICCLSMISLLSVTLCVSAARCVIQWPQQAVNVENSESSSLSITLTVRWTIWTVAKWTRTALKILFKSILVWNDRVCKWWSFLFLGELFL